MRFIFFLHCFSDELKRLYKREKCMFLWYNFLVGFRPEKELA